MPASAQGLLKQTVFAKQSALGTPATTGGQIMRRTNSVFTLTRDTFESNEIVSHQMSTGSNAGIQKTTGKLDCLLSAGTYALLIGSLLRKLFAATTAITAASITIGAVASGVYPVGRATGSYLTDGIKIGDVVRLTAGGFNAANLNKNLLVVSVTALSIGVRVLNNSALVPEGPITGATVTVPGKKAWTPMTGHVNEYWSVEEWYSDLTKSELFTDTKIAKADVTIPATGNATISFDVPGLGRTRGTAQAITAPATETTSNVLTAVNALIIVNGVVTPITGAQFSIDGSIQPGEPEVGSNSISDQIRGEVAVSGSFTGKFYNTLIQDIYDQQTVIQLILPVTDGSAAAAEFMVFNLIAVKVFGDAPDDGEAKEIIRTYPFTAQLNGSGGAALANLQTIMSVQDSLA